MMINKRIALSLVTIVGTLTAVVGITYAAFSTSVTLSENTLSTGDVDMQIASLSSAGGNCTDFGDSITGVQSNNILPGGSGSRYFCLRNTGSTKGIALEVRANATVVPALEGESQLEKSLVQIGVQCSNPGESLDETTAASIPVTLDNENPSAAIALVPKESTVTPSTVKCKITQTLSNSASDDAKGKSISYDIVFTGTQEEPEEKAE